MAFIVGFGTRHPWSIAPDRCCHCFYFLFHFFGGIVAIGLAGLRELRHGTCGFLVVWLLVFGSIPQFCYMSLVFFCGRIRCFVMKPEVVGSW